MISLYECKSFPMIIPRDIFFKHLKMKRMSIIVSKGESASDVSMKQNRL